MSEKSLRDGTVPRGEWAAGAISETFGSLCDENPERLGPKPACASYTAVRNAKKEIPVDITQRRKGAEPPRKQSHYSLRSLRLSVSA